MTISAGEATVPVEHTDRFFIGGQWVTPSSDSKIDVIDSHTEQVCLTVAEAQAADIDRAVTAAKEAFDHGPWPRLTHAERAAYLRALGEEVVKRSADIVQMWPREAGVIAAMAGGAAFGAKHTFNYYADLAGTFQWERPVRPSRGGFGLVVKEPVGVVGAIIPWNAPMGLISMKLAPALIAGLHGRAEDLPRGARRGVHHLRGGRGHRAAARRAQRALRRPRGLRAARPRPARRQDHLHRVHRRRAAHRVDLRGADRARHPGTRRQVRRRHPRRRGHRDRRAALAQAECILSGQVCASLTRIVVSRPRHDEMLEALASAFSKVRVGDPFDPASQMGPLAAERQRDRVEGYIAKGIEIGATLATGGGRPKDLDRGWYIEPTVFGNVDNSSVIAQEEIFGPVLSVIPADDEADAVRIANDTIYGLHGAVFTADVERAREVAGQMRTGAIGHNGFKSDFDMGHGGFKQSGIGREGGIDGLLPFLESKAMLLDGPTARYTDVQL